MSARASAALVAAILFARAATAAAVELTIVHTNDIHGWIMTRPSAAQPDRQIGGAAALAAFYRQVPGPKLLLDGGDWFQGTPEGSVSKGQALVDVLNALPYDAVAVGNHDFDFKEARLKELVAQLKMPVLAANVYDAKTHKRVPYLTPWIVKQVGGVKVGLFGLITTNMRNLVFPDSISGLLFENEVEQARKAVAELRAQGATVIIEVDHVGFRTPDKAAFTSEQVIAAEVEGIDLIVGGHSHTFLSQPYRDPVHGTLVVQDGSYLQSAGKVVLHVDDKTKRVTGSEGELVDLWVDRWGQDPQLAAIVAARAAEVSAVYDVAIASAEVALTRNNQGESTLGDWMTDCERDWAGADVAIQNAGGIRSDIAPGPVTMRHIFNVMPFDNYVVKLQLSGAQLREALDHGVDKTKGMVQTSGARFAYDRAGEAGRRLADVEAAGKPLDDAAPYRVSTIDFLVKGGDGFSPFSRAAKTEETGVLLRDVLAECARKQRILKLPAGDRMRPLSEGEVKGRRGGQ